MICVNANSLVQDLNSGRYVHFLPIIYATSTSYIYIYYIYSGVYYGVEHLFIAIDPRFILTWSDSTS